MSRTNVILLVVLAALLALYLAGRGDDNAPSGPAPRLFADFNIEAADRIVVEGGWPDSTLVLERIGSEWRVASAGGFPAKGDVADDFLEAVSLIRKENVVGSTPKSHADTHTDAKMGRLVRVFKGDTPMAEFRVGKNPKGSYQEIFVRAEGDDAVYRSRVVLPKELDKEPIQIPGLPRYGPRGFDWHNHVNLLSTEWVATKVWDLAQTEEQELWLTRPDLDVKLTKEGDDNWLLQVKDEEEKVPADADAAQAILSQLRYLNFSHVVGKYEDVRVEYGLDQPVATLVMTLRKEVEKKADEEEPKDEGEGEGDDEEKKPEKEWVTLKRTIEVGKKVQRPRDFRDGELDTEDYYPIKIGGVFDGPEEEQKAGYVYLVSTYNVDPLMKSLEEFKQEEEKKDEPGDEEKGDGETKDGEDAPAPKDEDGAEPTDPPKDEPSEPAEPKKDDPDEPDDPKKGDG